MEPALTADPRCAHPADSLPLLEDGKRESPARMAVPIGPDLPQGAWGRATGPDLESPPRAESAWRPPFSLPWGGLAVGPALTRAARGEVLADRSC